MKFSKITSVAVLATLPLLASCADEEESLIVAGAPQWQGTCAVQVPANVFLSRGILDVRFETEYIVPLELQNQLVSQMAGSANNGIDNSELQIVGADVKLSSAQDSGLIERLRMEGENYIEFSPSVPTNSIGGGDSLGYLVTGIPAATASVLASLRIEDALIAADDAEAAELAVDPSASSEEILLARRTAQSRALNRMTTIDVSIDIRARRTGNAVGDVGEIKARTFTFPVDVCFGCLFSCAGCSLEVDDDGDGSTDRTLTGICPEVVPEDATQRLSRADFAGTSVGCPSAQDDVFVPLACDN